MTIDEVLERLNLKYDDLTQDERKTYYSWLEVLGNKKVSLEDVKNYVVSAKESVEQELTKTGHDSRQDLFLKARLRNYLLLEAFLSTPEKAKRALEQAISGLVPRK